MFDSLFQASIDLLHTPHKVSPERDAVVEVCVRVASVLSSQRFICSTSTCCSAICCFSCIPQKPSAAAAPREISTSKERSTVATELDFAEAGATAALSLALASR